MAAAPHIAGALEHWVRGAHKVASSNDTPRAHCKVLVNRSGPCHKHADCVQTKYYYVAIAQTRGNQCKPAVLPGRTHCTVYQARQWGVPVGTAAETIIGA
jgi:hypothetical protein